MKDEEWAREHGAYVVHEYKRGNEYRKLWPMKDGAWCISDWGGWICGTYESKDAAILAFELPWGAHERLQAEANASHSDPDKRIITLQMVKEAAIGLRPDHNK